MTVRSILIVSFVGLFLELVLLVLATSWGVLLTTAAIVLLLVGPRVLRHVGGNKLRPSLPHDKQYLTEPVKPLLLLVVSGALGIVASVSATLTLASTTAEGAILSVAAGAMFLAAVGFSVYGVTATKPQPARGDLIRVAASITPPTIAVAAVLLTISVSIR